MSASGHYDPVIVRFTCFLGGLDWNFGKDRCIFLRIDSQYFLAIHFSFHTPWFPYSFTFDSYD